MLIRETTVIKMLIALGAKVPVMLDLSVTLLLMVKSLMVLVSLVTSLDFVQTHILMVLNVIMIHFALGVQPESPVLVNAITLKMHQNFHKPFLNVIKAKPVHNCTQNQLLVMPIIHAFGALFYYQ